ncbi:MAG TPA: RHS repeat-associated core domain-containing protein, partial [Actinomycetota bacterium]|nr:RHS repeat-associated core domain-containing protein [Actinomycetota bacterium]
CASAASSTIRIARSFISGGYCRRGFFDLVIAPSFQSDGVSIRPRAVQNSSGQLGNNSQTNSSVPVQVQGLTGVTAIAAGDDHSLGLKSDGTMWAWGDNEAGALGNNSTANSLVPIQVPGMSNVIAIAGGDTHTVALKSDGTVWAWGKNASGQLGNGTTANSLVPVQVSNLTGAVAIASGGHNSMALKSDGSVWVWGDNSAGQLGNNTTTGSSVPVQASGISAAGGIAIDGDDDDHTLAVKSDGTVWAWGSNTNGQLGNNSTTNSLVPIRSNMASVKLASTQATYAYNGDGLRMSKTVGGTVSQETWDVAEGLPLLLVDGSTDYVYGPGGRPLEQLSSSGTLFYHQDQLGSTRALTNASGVMVATYTFDSYGHLTASTGSVSNPFGLAGQYTDAETGLVYLRSRYYDPATAQFLSRDPFSALTGSAYGYTAGNPLNATDLSGFNCIPTGPPNDTATAGPGGSPLPLLAGIAENAGIGVADFGTVIVTAAVDGAEGAEIPDPFYIDPVELGDESIIANQAAGNAARDAIAARYPGANIEQTFQTALGARRVDVLTQDGLAIESKVGYTSLTKSIQLQIAKDQLLMQNPAISGVEWVFSASAVTGQVGPSGPLAEALDKAGIAWSIGP